MNRSNFYKKLRFVARYLKHSGLSESINQQRYSSCFTKHLKLNEYKVSSIAGSYSHYRNVSSSNLAKSDVKSNDPSTDEPNFNSDEEFQSILKDFAKDFDLDSESEKILEDIKQTLDKPENEGETASSTTGKGESSVAKNIDSQAVIGKFKDFSESDSVVIHGHEELQSGAYENEEETFHIDQNWDRDISEVHYKRGATGVYDINELVELLRNENVADIAVISIPKELHYADFLVLATAKSPRHSKAVAEYMIKVYKMKKNEKDPFIIVEGEKVDSWKALDMGNIVLHIFLEEARSYYDIESLWLFDLDYDTGGTLKPDPIFEAMHEQMAFFNSLQGSAASKASEKTT